MKPERPSTQTTSTSTSTSQIGPTVITSEGGDGRVRDEVGGEDEEGPEDDYIDDFPMTYVKGMKDPEEMWTILEG